MIGRVRKEMMNDWKSAEGDDEWLEECGRRWCMIKECAERDDAWQESAQKDVMNNRGGGGEAERDDERSETIRNKMMTREAAERGVERLLGSVPKMMNEWRGRGKRWWRDGECARRDHEWSGRVRKGMMNFRLCRKRWRKIGVFEKKWWMMWKEIMNEFQRVGKRIINEQTVYEETVQKEMMNECRGCRTRWWMTRYRGMRR
jgi:hypothetical protein